MSINDVDVLVMYAPIKDTDMTEPLVPKERQQEVEGCKNERVRREKYLVWKLLAKATKQGLNLDFDNLNFTKMSFNVDSSSFLALTCVKGSGSINGEEFNLGDTYFSPAGAGEITVEGELEFITVGLPEQ